MRFLILLVIFPSFVYADQGVKISCVNMKNLLDQNYKIHKFKFDVTTFQYFDEKKNIFVDCNTGKKSQSKLLPYTLFQFIDKHSFSIICTSILILTVIGGLYVIEDQRAKHDLIETLTIKDDTSTDSSVDSDETVTTSYRGYYILFMTMGYVTLVYSIIMCNRSDPQGFQLLGDTYFPTPMIAYAIFLETLAFVLIDVHGNIIYVIFESTICSKKHKFN